MRRASFFLTLAAGLVASLALSASTQAGSLLYDVDATVVVTMGTATTAEVEFTGPVTGPVTILPSTTLPTPVSATASGDYVHVTFGSAGVGMYDFEFSVTGDTGLAGIGGSLTSGGGVQGGVFVDNVSAAVPEPASVALLGVGMAGLFAFRRVFRKRAATV